MGKKRDFAREFARKGGEARARKLSKERQSEIGRKAAAARMVEKECGECGEEFWGLKYAQSPLCPTCRKTVKKDKKSA